MIPRELAKKIRLIEISSRKAVNELLAGEYGSVFKGQGLEFDEVREYTPGDDVRSIDWNVTARAGRPFIKRYIEERELTVIFAADMSGSGRFGSTDQTKREMIAELCALLAFSAVKNNDRVGLVLFTESVEKFIPPAKGSRHVLRLIRELLQFTPANEGTRIAAALDYIGRVQRRHAAIFVISDFFDTHYEQSLKMLSRRHDVVALSVKDPREVSLPAVGMVALRDIETEQLVVIDTSSAEQRRRYEAFVVQRNTALRELFRSIEVDHIEVRAGSEYVRDLVRFFRLRGHRGQSGRLQ